MYRYFNVSVFQLCYVFTTHTTGPPTNGAPAGNATYQQKQQVIIELTTVMFAMITIIDAHFNSSTGQRRRRNDINVTVMQSSLMITMTNIRDYYHMLLCQETQVHMLSSLFTASYILTVLCVFEWTQKIIQSAKEEFSMTTSNMTSPLLESRIASLPP